MKTSKPIITAHIWTEQFLGTAEKAIELLVLLKTLDGGRWVPDKWSQFEPVKNSFAEEHSEQLVRDWVEERHGRVSNLMFFKKARPHFFLNVTSWRGRVPDLNYLWFDIDASEFASANGPTRLKDIMTKFVGWSGAAYGTARHSLQHHDRYANGNPMKRLERLNWLTFFGDRYLEFFGKDHIQACPFYSCEMVADGLLLTAAERPDSPSMTESDTALIGLEKCLGADAFATENYPEIPCRVPRFDLRQTVNT